MKVLAADPGATGGVALIEDGAFVRGLRMPVLKHGKRKLVDTLRLSDWLGPDVPDHFVIEQVGAMPSQGSVSGFNFGRATGAIEAWAIGHGKPVHWVTPAVWKKALNLSKDKRASMDAARLRFGDDPLWQVLANDGIAEAALLGAYWMEKNHG